MNKNQRVKQILCIFLFSLSILSLIAGVVISLILKYNAYDIVVALCTLTAGAVFPYFITYCSNNVVHPWYRTFDYLLRKHSIKKQEVVRVSYAVLFKISVGNKFFLIRDEHQISSFKVPGGTYKISDEEKTECVKRFGINDDDQYGFNIKKEDYRLYVPVKNLKSFYKRFRSIKQETASEIFKRRVVDEGKLPKEIFNNVNLSYLGEDIVIKYPKYFRYYEMVLADIYNLDLNEEQRNYLIKMIENQKEFNKYDLNNLPAYYFATKEEIIRRGVNPQLNLPRPWIADNSYKIFRDLPPRESYTEY